MTKNTRKMSHRINTRNQFHADGGSVKSIRTYLLTAMNPFASCQEQIAWMRSNFNHYPAYKKVIDKIEKQFTEYLNN